MPHLDDIWYVGRARAEGAHGVLDGGQRSSEGAEEVGRTKFNVATPTYAYVTFTRHVQHRYYHMI